MGTKIQLDNYYPMRDLNHDLNGTSWASYHGENNLPNGQYYYGVLPRPNPDLFRGVDKDLLKQKMLEHEAIFKNQVFELHRLYRVQRDLMSEIRRKEDLASSSSQTTPEKFSFLFSNSVIPSANKGKNVQSPRNSVVSESRPTKVRRMIDLHLPAEEYVDLDEVDQSEKMNGLADLNEVPEVEESSCYNDGGNGDNWFSSMLKAGMKNQANHIMKEDSRPKKANNCMNRLERRMNSVSAKCSQLPIQRNDSPGTWWNQNSKIAVEDSQVSKASSDYVNGSNSKKAIFDLNGLSDEAAKEQDHDVSVLPPWLRANKTDSVVDATKREKKVLFDMNLPCSEDLEEEENIESGRSNGARNMFDLNSCLTEDEVPLTATSPTNSSKKSEKCVVDLEVPLNLEVEDEDLEIIGSSEDKEIDESLARVAAEAIISMSSLVPENRVNESVSSPEDALMWLVDIALERSTDSFEEMTLKLRECSVDEYFPNQPKFEFLKPDTSGPGPMTGRAKRGKKRKDFQRDILPGLASLARNDITEDLQTFGGLMRATGHDWQCGARKNGSRRGRKKGTTVKTTVTTTFGCSQKTGEMSVLVDGSLTGWGKTTRRPRRQRGLGNTAPIALT